MRVGELAALKWDDVGDGVLLLHRKGNKQDTVCPGVVAMRELMRLPRTEPRVFARSYSGIKAAFRRLSAKSGVPFYPHKMRHTFAHLFIAQGGSIEDLSEIMSHANLNTTAIYLRAFRRERALEAMRRWNPADILLDKTLDISAAV